MVKTSSADKLEVHKMKKNPKTLRIFRWKSRKMSVIISDVTFAEKFLHARVWIEYLYKFEHNIQLGWNPNFELHRKFKMHHPNIRKRPIHSIQNNHKVKVKICAERIQCTFNAINSTFKNSFGFSHIGIRLIFLALGVFKCWQFENTKCWQFQHRTERF